MAPAGSAHTKCGPEAHCFYRLGQHIKIDRQNDPLHAGPQPSHALRKARGTSRGPKRGSPPPWSRVSLRTGVAQHTTDGCLPEERIQKLHVHAYTIRGASPQYKSLRNPWSDVLGITWSIDTDPRYLCPRRFCGGDCVYLFGVYLSVWRSIYEAMYLFIFLALYLFI